MQRDVFCFLFLRLAAAESSSNLFFSSIDVSFDPMSHGDVITVICGMEHRGLDSAGSF